MASAAVPVGGKGEEGEGRGRRGGSEEDMVRGAGRRRGDLVSSMGGIRGETRGKEGQAQSRKPLSAEDVRFFGFGPPS
eukprot:766061-Hanusia_phi.AAC.4